MGKFVEQQTVQQETKGLSRIHCVHKGGRKSIGMIVITFDAVN